jgi:DNA repair exonuclease SbcCD ATPase subunit
VDIQHLVDRLEDLIDEGRHMPFSKYTMVDEERALEIIDQMRISIPEEIEKASRVLAQRDRILAAANEDAARIIQQAREQGVQLLDREATVQAAQSRAANIVEQARQEAEAITAEADRYVMETLAKLEQNLSRALNQVRNGINELASEAEESDQQPTQSVQSVSPVQFPAPMQRQTVDALSGKPADGRQENP